MKAAYIEKTGSVEHLKVGELPKPTPGPGEVLVRLKYAALNHLDLWIREGIPGHRLSFPHILGADGAGTIEKTGQEVIVNPAVSCMKCRHCTGGLEKLCEKYQILGEDRAGTNAEFISVPESNIFPKPKELSFQEAAAFPLVTITAWEMLVGKAAVKAGDTVLVHGAGSGVSQMAIQIANHFKAAVIATSTSQEKLTLAKKLGATHTIHSTTQDFYKEVKLVAPKGVDIIVDHVGKSVWEKNIKLLTAGGVLVTCGATSGFEAMTDLRHIFFRQLRLMGSTMGNKRDFPRLIELMRNGTLRAVVGEEFPLDRIREAHGYLKSGKQSGKVLLRIS